MFHLSSSIYITNPKNTVVIINIFLSNSDITFINKNIDVHNIHKYIAVNHAMLQFVHEEGANESYTPSANNAITVEIIKSNNHMSLFFLCTTFLS